MKKKLLALILVAVMAMTLMVGCGSADNQTYQIGVLQLTQHAALDAANEGFIAALDASGIKYEVDQQNASGEQTICGTIAEKFVNDGKDLIYRNSSRTGSCWSDN